MEIKNQSNNNGNENKNIKLFKNCSNLLIYIFLLNK